MTHKLKTLPIYFNRCWDCSKSFEVRFNDIDFQKGDKIELLEFDGKEYTGRSLIGNILYVLSDFEGLKDGYIAFSFDVENFIS